MIGKKKSRLFAEIDGIIDDHIINGKMDDFCFYTWLKNHEIPGWYMRSIIDKLTEILYEYEVALKGEDQEISEGYAHLTKKTLRSRVTSFKILIEKAELYGDGTRKLRKPRKRKPISAENKLRYIQYKKEDEQYVGLLSINPLKILGATELYIYDTKYKKITRFCAANEKGLDIYRTAITNFSDQSQTYLTGKRSKTILTELLNGGRVYKKQVIGKLKPAPKLQTRINKETILLGVVL